MNRSRSFLAAEAIQEYVSVKAWQINEIKKGLTEADAGDFASEEEVQRVFKSGRGVRVEWLQVALDSVIIAEAESISQ
jgi:predicted transcriptional regulator